MALIQHVSVPQCAYLWIWITMPSFLYNTFTQPAILISVRALLPSTSYLFSLTECCINVQT